MLDDPTNWRASTLVNGSPDRADSSPLQLGIATKGTGITLQFSAIPTQTYRIEFRDTLSGGTWQMLRQVSNASGLISVDEAIQLSGERFYRVVIPAP